jgi:hypothetical protein
VWLVGESDRAAEVLTGQTVFSVVSVVDPAQPALPGDGRPDCVVIDLDTVSWSCLDLVEDVTDAWGRVPIVAHRSRRECLRFQILSSII